MTDYDRIKEAIEVLKVGQNGDDASSGYNVTEALKYASFGGIGAWLLFVFLLVVPEEYTKLSGLIN